MGHKWNGYRPLHRNDFYLLSEGLLNREDLLLYIFVVNQLNFDPEKEGHHGVLTVNIAEYLEVLGYSDRSPNSIYKKLDKLTNVGLIIPLGKPYNKYRVHLHKRHIASVKRWGGEADKYRKSEMSIDSKELIANICQNVQLTEKGLQVNERIIQRTENTKAKILKKDAPRDLSSSKGESITKRKKAERELGHYQKQIDDLGLMRLTADDAKWISEELLPTYEEKDSLELGDQDIADVFFGSNLSKSKLYMKEKHV